MRKTRRLNARLLFLMHRDNCILTANADGEKSASFCFISRNCLQFPSLNAAAFLPSFLPGPICLVQLHLDFAAAAAHAHARAQATNYDNGKFIRATALAAAAERDHEPFWQASKKGATQPSDHTRRSRRDRKRKSLHFET
jgi:hypothetical protein